MIFRSQLRLRKRSYCSCLLWLSPNPDICPQYQDPTLDRASVERFITTEPLTRFIEDGVYRERPCWNAEVSLYTRYHSQSRDLLALPGCKIIPKPLSYTFRFSFSCNFLVSLYTECDCFILGWGLALLGEVQSTVSMRYPHGVVLESAPMGNRLGDICGKGYG